VLFNKATSQLIQFFKAVKIANLTLKKGNEATIATGYCPAVPAHTHTTDLNFLWISKNAPDVLQSGNNPRLCNDPALHHAVYLQMTDTPCVS
jgi:hypothetical protein